MCGPRKQHFKSSQSKILRLNKSTLLKKGASPEDCDVLCDTTLSLTHGNPRNTTEVYRVGARLASERYVMAWVLFGGIRWYNQTLFGTERSEVRILSPRPDLG